MINFVIWLIMGGLVGWLASILMHTNAQQGTLLNIVVGIVGAFIAGLVLTPLLGAIILLAIVSFLLRGGLKLR